MPIADPNSTASAVILSGQFSDISSVETLHFAAPDAGYIKELLVTVSGNIGAFPSHLTLATKAGSVSVVTIPGFGSPGDVSAFQFSKEQAQNRVAANESFSLASDGGGSISAVASVVVVIERY